MSVLGWLAGLLPLLVATSASGASSLVDPGPFGPTSVRLENGRVIAVPAETHAFYRMLTQDGRIGGPKSAAATPDDVREGIALRKRHEPAWTARFGQRRLTPESAYVFPVEGARLPPTSGYSPGHRAEDLFAPPGRKVLAPATMLIVHAGYLGKTAGEAVVGFAPAGPGQPRARYFVLVHIDAGPAKGKLGQVVEAGSIVGYIAEGDEAVVGNALGRPTHLHFVIREEKDDGRLEGIRLYELLKRSR
ncbi:MAG: peptidoglycan DD-metalloendopeptidase family protein [Candidatus Rokubacteria bacterium]|nr:peptidoglycan DD-metalloendopeptidase family protein [Candidatus Rokubacteria bacterium]